MRVVSWNIHWGCGKDGRIRIHAIIDVLRKLNPDVICLQEVASNHAELEGNANANQFRQLAGRGPYEKSSSCYDHVSAPQRRPWRSGGMYMPLMQLSHRSCEDCQPWRSHKTFAILEWTAIASLIA